MIQKKSLVPRVVYGPQNDTCQGVNLLISLLKQRTVFFLMARSHCTEPGPGLGTGKNGFLYIVFTVHTALRQGQGPEPLFSIVLVPFPVPVPVPVPCSVNEP